MIEPMPKEHGEHLPQSTLSDSGMKVTQPRLHILEALGSSESPVSAEDMFRLVKAKTRKNPDIVTIYRSLEAFAKAGIARKVRFKDKTVRYELGHMDREDHCCHHAVCDSCGMTEHIDDPEIEKALAVLSKKLKKVKFIKEHALELFGECGSCHAGARAASRSGFASSAGSASASASGRKKAGVKKK